MLRRGLRKLYFSFASYFSSNKVLLLDTLNWKVGRKGNGLAPPALLVLPDSTTPETTLHPWQQKFFQLVPESA